MKKLVFIFWSTFSLIALSQEAVNSTPTDQETKLLELINRFRSNPTKEAKLILNSIDVPEFVNKKLFLQEVSTLKPQQPLFFDRRLIQAARSHNKYQMQHGQGHTQLKGKDGFSGKNVKKRINKVGLTAQLLGSGENTYMFAQSLFHGQAAFIIDWGQGGEGGMQENRGHRLNLISSNYKLVGLAVQQSDKYLAITQNFASVTGHFIGGVAYEDKNGNGTYDLNEGIGGVRVDYKDKTTFTWSSGAYALPIDDQGGIIHFSFKDRFQTYFLNKSSKNTKLDYIQNKSNSHKLTYAELYKRDFESINLSALEFFRIYKDQITSNYDELREAFKATSELSSSVEITNLQREHAKTIYGALKKYFMSKVLFLKRRIAIKPISSFIELEKIQQIIRNEPTLVADIAKVMKTYSSKEFNLACDLYEKRIQIGPRDFQKAVSKLNFNKLSKEATFELQSELKKMPLK
ncbi:MAG: CAP domain-containing protein [Lentisphaeraceae bacterium]|nr:CAP domain-containing protein [Lentisphaeraceae bacterium]